LQAARREASEEGGLPLLSKIIELDSMCTVPANIFRDWKKWPPGTYVVKEYAFGIEADESTIILSDEHTEFKWCSFNLALESLKWDSNKTALWELSQRLGES
jgi:dATP pyrophosphohydrolase